MLWSPTACLQHRAACSVIHVDGVPLDVLQGQFRMIGRYKITLGIIPQLVTACIPGSDLVRVDSTGDRENLDWQVQNYLGNNPTVTACNPGSDLVRVDSGDRENLFETVD